MWNVGFYFVRGFAVGLEYVEFEEISEEYPWEILIHIHLGLFRISLEKFPFEEESEY
jgi:hypothetical protein